MVIYGNKNKNLLEFNNFGLKDKRPNKIATGNTVTIKKIRFLNDSNNSLAPKSKLNPKKLGV